MGSENTQFISGSGTNIEISSSNFHLTPDGQVTMSGQLAVEAGGTIGGFDIGTNKIQSATDGSNTAITVTNNGSSYYIFDGVNQPTLTFVVGNTYVFTMSSGVMSSHPFRIGTSANGDVITDGVTVTSTSLTIVVSASTPTSLFYFCTSHSGMGSSISVNQIPIVLDGISGNITGSGNLEIAGNISGSSTSTGSFG